MPKMTSRQENQNQPGERRLRQRRQSKRSRSDTRRVTMGTSGPVTTRVMTSEEYEERFGSPMPVKLQKRAGETISIEYPEPSPGTCKFCGKTIAWIRKGKWIPVDPVPLKDASPNLSVGYVSYGPEVYRSHFLRCRRKSK